jgi:hypothetical protein
VKFVSDVTAWATAWRAGTTVFGSYFDWHRDWQLHLRSVQEQEPDLLDSRALWLHYEDIQKSPHEQIMRLARFLNIPLAEDTAFLNEVIALSSFKAMKEQAGEAGSFHLRKGVVGDWKTRFSPELSNSFIEQFRSECAGSGLTFCLGKSETTGEDVIISAP